MRERGIIVHCEGKFHKEGEGAGEGEGEEEEEEEEDKDEERLVNKYQNMSIQTELNNIFFKNQNITSGG